MEGKIARQYCIPDGQAYKTPQTRSQNTSRKWKTFEGQSCQNATHQLQEVDVTDTRKVVETSNSVYAHKIRLLDIRH